MAQRKNLLTIDYHYDDETGMYRVGEIDFGVSGNIKGYLETYGADGMKNILAGLGRLSHEVISEFNEIMKEKEKKSLAVVGNYNKHN